MNSLEAISPIVGFTPSGKPVNREQQLVLLRLDPMLLCGRFAEMKESPDLTAGIRRDRGTGREKVGHLLHYLYRITI